MNIKDELIQYCNYCLEDKYISDYEDYISCVKHKWACKRFLNDLAKENFPYYWSEEEAQKIVKWFTFLRHSKGVLSRESLSI